ncbi:cell division protein SepF [Gloeocapsopsis crepidinum LEGE 06123]|uniref:Cell division protein SepF n=1 Tax=Gloeocapsopsis crepidinum LEGE 06123 TaxID=588587 RepID=A0ABR9URA4_9CHRO|nr:cell division protein SepF [Gloeocapsopsis crepidinum]MBE9190816.1 cell division protein SepF [Gloeocapsopsis crepidinum LEGE 06123]
MSKFIKTIKEFVGLNDPYADDDDVEYVVEEDGYRHTYQSEPSQPIEEDLRQRRRVRERITLEPNSEVGAASMNNVIGMPGAGNRMYEVVVMEPRSFEEMPQAIQALRERKSVVLNLTMMDPDLAQRAVDFVAGGTYAIDGHQERVGDSIFLFTPICVQVTTQSGVVQEVPQTQVRTERTTVHSQAWSADSTRIAQSS